MNAINKYARDCVDLAVKQGMRQGSILARREINKAYQKLSPEKREKIDKACWWGVKQVAGAYVGEEIRKGLQSE